MMKVIVDPKVVNITRYIPVEPETAGGIPILRSTGLKMAPPPRPKAPETQPPIKATVTSLLMTGVENIKSLFALTLFFFSLKDYSQSCLLIAKIVTTTHTTKKNAHIIKSYHEQSVYPGMMDGVLFDPLIRFTVTCVAKTLKHMPCFSHCLCDFSFSNISLSILSSSALSSRGFSIASSPWLIAYDITVYFFYSSLDA